MIITHAANAHGDVRLYLGGKGSIECWLEPTLTGSWSFHMDDAVTGNRLSDADKKAWAVHLLSELANALAISPEHLASVPFQTIAHLHTHNPYEGRRLPVGRRVEPDDCFKSVPPHIRAKFTGKARSAGTPRFTR